MSKDMMKKQLSQVFEYAELKSRLSHCKEILDPEGGYVSEMEVHEKIEELEKTIEKKMKIHLRNSGVSERALNIVNNTKYFLKGNLDS